MSENLKTIRELADEFNVSKQAVRKRLTDEFFSNYVETVYSNSFWLHAFKAAFFGCNDSGKVASNSKKNADEVSVLKIVEQQLAVKDRQLENKDSQISQMQNLLDQQQRLALQDKKLLEEYKSEIKNLKSLSIPSKDIEKEDAIQKDNTVENNKEMIQKQNKKWWQFGRRM